MTPPATPAAPLRADCIGDSAGGLTFDVAARGNTGAALLVLRRRVTDAVDAAADTVSLPLAPAAAGRLRAALPSSVSLPEGRWDAYARLSDGRPRRLVPGVTDLRSLAERIPSGLLGHVAVRIPYATRQGNLTVRSWLRAPHAEAVELRLASGGLTVRGRVYGTQLVPGADAELRARPDEGEGGRGGAGVRRVEVAAERTEFAFTVPYDGLAPGLWDLWLRPAGDAGPVVRLARLLDDVADKNPVLTFPRARVRTPHGPVEAGPYYTRDNDLSLAVAPLEA
ncbi:hypothetical protein [Streptomyces tendae]|uniref:Transferase n=1 Tax=Streptomyces tendae TaxID=1932 RepID=A0ABW7S6N7_STRTE|nr:hypothetical protein [Streptomyces sp. SID5914]MZG12993.1 hypothetical protein [Streptomyces sp. SID5914]MZG15209.1 hypothetical protein [Streptomyces sp. SID5914]